MKQELKTLKDLREKTLEELKERVKDKNIPIEKRWNEFVEYGEEGLVPQEKWVQHFEGEIEEWSDKDYLDGERVQKHERVTAKDMLNNAEDDEKSEEFINDLKEQWMKKFIWSFNFNW